MEIIKRDDVLNHPMGEVLRISEKNGMTTVSAKDLYEFLGYDKSQWARWSLKNIVNEEYFIEGVDYEGFDMVSNGNITTDYGISLDMAKELCMLSRNSRGKEARQYFIFMENKARNSINKYTLPQSYSEALRQLATTVEQNEKLQLENKQKEETITKQLPKVEFYDAVAGSDDILEMGEVAKILTMGEQGRNQLFAFLRDKGVLMKNNQPYQKYVDAGYFKVIESTWSKPNGDVQINLKTVVYQKGLDYIRKLLAK